MKLKELNSKLKLFHEYNFEIFLLSLNIVSIKLTLLLLYVKFISLKFIHGKSKYK